MIELKNLCKTFFLNGKRKTVADNISLIFPPNRSVALLGRNGAGKSTLLKIISGGMKPDTGQVITHGTVSWPVGFAGSFHPELTGLQNTRFIARIQGVDSDELVEFVQDFAAIGSHFYLPVRTYSSGMRSRLAFGVSMGIHFDTYLVDEITAVGDADFRAKSDIMFAARLETSGVIMVTHSLGQVQRLCDHVVVLENGQVRFFEDVKGGISFYQRLIRGEISW